MYVDHSTCPAPSSLALRHGSLQHEMIEEYERYVAAGKHWALYLFQGWHHLAICVFSHYLLEVVGVRTRWQFGVLWAVQTGVALGAVALFQRRTPVEKSPLQRHVNRTCFVFVLLCWNVAILNVMAGLPFLVFRPALATLSSFTFLVLASFLSRRFVLAALAMCATGGLMARFPAYSFIIYGIGWLLVLETLGVVFYRRSRRWFQVDAARTSAVPADEQAAADRLPPPRAVRSNGYSRPAEANTTNGS